MKTSCGSSDEHDAGFSDGNSDLEEYAESGGKEIAENDVGTVGGALEGEKA